jgi:hypothetical protein
VLRLCIEDLASSILAAFAENEATLPACVGGGGYGRVEDCCRRSRAHASALAIAGCAVWRSIDCLNGKLALQHVHIAGTFTVDFRAG